jgi:hypothetical protein
MKFTRLLIKAGLDKPDRNHQRRTHLFTCCSVLQRRVVTPRVSEEQNTDRHEGLKTYRKQNRERAIREKHFVFHCLSSFFKKNPLSLSCKEAFIFPEADVAGDMLAGAREALCR